MSSTYADAEALVSSGWVAEHLNDPKVKLVEVPPTVTSVEAQPRSTGIRMSPPMRGRNRVV